MSIVKPLWENREYLVDGFQFAIRSGLLATWSRCKHRKNTPEEPDFVASLVLESAPLIYSALTTALSRRNISVSMCSVFCHQTPQVTFGNPSATCELGDVLFAYVHTPKNGEPIRNALLFQVKMYEWKESLLSEGSNQLRLYSTWPDFEFTRSSFLNNKKRSVTPKTPHPGAQYLLIEDGPLSDTWGAFSVLLGRRPMRCCMPDEHLFSHSELVAELFNLFIFRTGRPFDDKITASKKNDWSQVVWDLIESGVRKAFNRKNSGRCRSPRLSGNDLLALDGMSIARASSAESCSTVSNIIGRDEARAWYESSDDLPPSDRYQESISSDSETGLSLVLIETSEEESEE